MRSWATLGAYVGGLGLLLRPTLAVLGISWGLFGRSGAEKCEDVAIFKMCLFLEREHDLRPVGRSGAALGAYFGSLGTLLGPM